MEFYKLPVEVLNNIISCKLEEPDYMKIKHNHNEELKRIQRRCNINKTEPEIKTTIITNIGGEKIQRQVFQYFICPNWKTHAIESIRMSLRTHFQKYV